MGVLGKPVRLVYTGEILDDCNMCSLLEVGQNSSARYMLPCNHVICTDCLTTCVPAKPLTGTSFTCLCLETVTFDPVPPVEMIRVDSESLDSADKVRNSKHVMDNAMCFVSDEAIYLLGELLTSVKNQVVSPEALGDIPDHLKPFHGDVENVFFKNLKEYFISVKEEFFIRPTELEMKLQVQINLALHQWSLTWCKDALVRNQHFFRALQNNDIGKCVWVATEEVKEIRELHDTWFELAGKLVGLLAVRHLSRFNTNPVEDSILNLD